MRNHRWHVVPAVVAASALTLLAYSPAAGVAPDKVKPCKLLKSSEISSAFGKEAGKGTAQGTDCTWQLDNLALSLDVTTSEAKATFESLRDLAVDAGSTPEKIKGVGNHAVYTEIPSFKELLVLKGKKFLFLRLLDIANPVDTETARTALTQLGKKAAKRA